MACPSVGQTRLHPTSVWGRHVNRTPKGTAKMSALHLSVGQTQPHCAQARGTNVHSLPQRERGACKFASHPLCVVYTSTTRPSVGQKCQVHIAPQCAVYTSTAGPSVGQTRPHAVDACAPCRRWGILLTFLPHARVPCGRVCRTPGRVVKVCVQRWRGLRCRRVCPHVGAGLCARA